MVKIQGQRGSTENLKLVIAQPWFKVSSPNLAIRISNSTQLGFESPKVNDFLAYFGDSERLWQISRKWDLYRLTF